MRAQHKLEAAFKGARRIFALRDQRKTQNHILKDLRTVALRGQYTSEATFLCNKMRFERLPCVATINLKLNFKRAPRAVALRGQHNIDAAFYHLGHLPCVATITPDLHLSCTSSSGPA